MEYISFTNVSKFFETGNQQRDIVTDCSFSLPTIGLVSLLGKSGCGKTTILNIIAGLENVNKGRVTIGNTEISSMNERRKTDFRRENISYVFQNCNLIDDMTVYENIDMYLSIKGKHKPKSEIEKKLKEFNLSNAITQKTITLSGGEKQRVSLICALLADSKIILLDEPTGALDEASSALVMKDIVAISKNVLVIMVSHNRVLIESFSDIILELKDQKVSTIRRIESARPIIKREIKAAGSSFKLKLLHRFLKLSVPSNVITMLVTSFAFLCLLTGFSFFTSSEGIVNQSLFSRPDAFVIRCEKQELRQESGALIMLTKTFRPDIEDAHELTGNHGNIAIEYSLGGILNQTQTFLYKGKKTTEVLFKPCSIVEMAVNEVVINNKMAELIRFENSDLSLGFEILSTDRKSTRLNSSH